MSLSILFFFFFFFFNDTATTEIYTLSLHDALPIRTTVAPSMIAVVKSLVIPIDRPVTSWRRRSEEHTSELQSRSDLVCRLLLEKKKKKDKLINNEQKKQQKINR